MNKIRFTIRIREDLHEWFKVYAQKLNTSMSTLMTQYLESLRDGNSSVQQGAEQTDEQIKRVGFEIAHLNELLEEKTDQAQYLREQLGRTHQSLDQAQQLLAVQTKTNASLTDRLQAIEDMRHRPWWLRLFQWT